jgi:RNase P subunit RPR2
MTIGNLRRASKLTAGVMTLLTPGVERLAVKFIFTAAAPYDNELFQGHRKYITLIEQVTHRTYVTSLADQYKQITCGWRRLNKNCANLLKNLLKNFGAAATNNNHALNWHTL